MVIDIIEITAKPVIYDSRTPLYFEPKVSSKAGSCTIQVCFTMYSFSKVLSYLKVSFKTGCSIIQMLHVQGSTVYAESHYGIIILMFCYALFIIVCDLDDQGHVKVKASLGSGPKPCSWPMPVTNKLSITNLYLLCQK